MGRVGSASASAKTQRKTGQAQAPVPEKNDILLYYLFSIHRSTRYVNLTTQAKWLWMELPEL